jgi:transposase-like protein
MSRSKVFSSIRRRTDATKREQLLEAFDRSGLSAAEFARQHRLNYGTFYGWRHRRNQSRELPAFVQVEVAAPSAPAELLIEVGAAAQIRLQSEKQIALAVKLLQQLNPPQSC